MPSEAVLVLRDVSLRDGLQNEAPISLVKKISIFEALVNAGVTDLELAAFVRPDRVPAMADAEQLAHATAAVAGITRWGLVLNRRGAERALASGIRHLQFVLSVSETHNLENAGATLKHSLEAFNEVSTMASESGSVLELTLATAFGCPFDGPVPVDAVLKLAEIGLEAGAGGIGLADTIGTAMPTESANVTAAVVKLAGSIPVGGHFHDTRGLAIANGLAALGEGASRLDASVAGLGGCPFAQGASGNVPLEDLLHALEGTGVKTGVDLNLVLQAAQLASESVGRPISSHIGLAGPRFATR